MKIIFMCLSFMLLANCSNVQLQIILLGGIVCLMIEVVKQSK
jgi:hypothetical protein